MNSPSQSLVPASAASRWGGGEQFFQVLPEIIVPVNQREGGLPAVPELILDLGVSEQQEESLHRFAVEGQAAGRELVLDVAVLPVGRQVAVFGRQRLLQLVE